MGEKALLISKGNLQEKYLLGKTALITGAGGGIGFQTARSLIWLGVKVIIVEIDKTKGENAEKVLNIEFGNGSALFIHTNIGNPRSVKKLVSSINKINLKVDIIINNATITHIGKIHETDINKWDSSYKTNLRGPILILHSFLPHMMKRNEGIIVFVSSSGAAPYMGAYEIFKTSQVELANTLAGELEGTNIITYSIAPGLVRTDTANKTIEKLAPLYNKNVEEFYNMSKNMILSVEEAGAGFAGSIALAEEYRGMEIGSIQVLRDIGLINYISKSTYLKLSDDNKNENLVLLNKINNTFIKQSDGWFERPIFERQWVIRDFKKHTGRNIEFYKNIFTTYIDMIDSNEISWDNTINDALRRLSSYYRHQIDLLKGYETNQDKVIEQTKIITGWVNNIGKLIEEMSKLKS